MLMGLIVGASILLMLLRPRGIAEAYWVGAGAVALVVCGLLPVSAAWTAVKKGNDVYLFLVGMMLLAELARACGVFDWLAASALQYARGSSVRLFTLVYGIGTLVTVCMSNDATAVVLTPAIAVAAQKAKGQPAPHLFACAFIANAASFVLPISNPANLVVFHNRTPSLGHWLRVFGVPSLLSIAVTYLVLRWLFREPLRAPIATTASHRLGSDGKAVLAGLAAMTAVLLVASAVDIELGLPTCLTALAIVVVVCLVKRNNPVALLRAISWPTLVLVAGLFVLVEAVTRIGVVDWLTPFVAHGGLFTVGLATAVANNVVNNLPLGLIASAVLQAAHAPELTTNTVLIAVDLGPNLSITGSLATILWLLALRKKGIHIGFWSFLKVGAVAMPTALVAALIGLYVLR